MTKNKFEELIDETGIKKNFIAKSLGLSRSALYKRLKNPKNMDTNDVENLAKVIGVDAEKLFTTILSLPKVDK